MGERRRDRSVDGPAPPGTPAAREGDPLAWLRDGPALVRRLVMAEILGPPGGLRRRRRPIRG
jgi:hypothetical protein